MFLRGGDYPAHILAFDNSVRISRTPARQYQDEPPPLDEIKIRLQRVQEALEFIRGQARRR